MDPMDLDKILSMHPFYKGDWAYEESMHSEGSDVGYSSYDFKQSDKFFNDKNKEHGAKRHGFKLLNSVNNSRSLYGGGTGIGKQRNNSIKIVFGSNMHQRFDQMPVVRKLTSHNPDIVIFLGTASIKKNP